MNKFKESETCTKTKLKLSIIAVTALMALGCSTTNAPQVSPDGLTLKKSTRSTIAYKKEQVNFVHYDKIQILPSAVAFKKNWQRDYNRSQVSLSTRIRDKDVIRIKAQMAKLFDEVFNEEFSQEVKFPLVNNVSSNTLVIRPAIINLDISAPDLQSITNVKTFTSEAGQATLFLELYDGVSGEILARVIHESVAGDKGYNQWATRISNRADAKRMIKKWAKTLRKKFDEVHLANTQKSVK